MKKLLALGAAAGIATVSLLATAPAAQAAPGAPGKAADGQCVKAGLDTLRGLGALPLAAQGKLDYAPYGTNGLGLINLPLEKGSFIPLSTVISLHLSSPELFAWCKA